MARQAYEWWKYNMMELSHLSSKNLEELHYSDCHTYIKNRSGIILYCNELQAKSLGVARADDVIRKNSYDLITDDVLARNIRTNDEKILFSNKATILFENCVFKGEKRSYISYKIPLLGYKNKIKCLFGISVPLKKENKLFQVLSAKKGISLIASRSDSCANESLDKMQNNSFSLVEQKCLYHLVRKMSIERIALCLSLSKRTVEYHLNSVKERLGCATNAELIIRVLSQSSC